MRASPSFNAIAAPVLYHSVEIVFPDPNKRAGNPFATRREKYGSNPFYLPVQKPWMKRKAKKVASKEENLVHVRHITYSDHNHNQCCDLGFPLAGLKAAKNIQSVRVNSPSEHSNAPTSTDRTLLPVLHYGKCAITAAIPSNKPAKVVLHCMPMFSPRPYPPPNVRYKTSPSPRTVVAILTGDSGNWQLDRRHLKVHTYGRTSTRMVYIIWTSVPFTEALTLGTNTIDENKNNATVFLANFAVQLALDVCWDSPAIKDVVVVNISSATFMGPEGGPRQDVASSLQDKVREMPKTNPSFAGHKGDPPKAITFVSMRRYLAEYDWAGEFIKEEVAGWLDATDEDEKRWLDGEYVPEIASGA